MALSMICPKGHHYVQPDIVVGERPPGMPICPECAKEWLAEREIQDVQRVRLEPGDVLVVRYDGILASSAKDRVAQQFETLFPDHKVIVMDGGPKVSVVGLGE
jgi:hypothetical protein